VENAIISGSETTGDVLTLTVHDPALTGGQASVSYTMWRQPDLYAAALASAIDGDSALSKHHLSRVTRRCFCSVARAGATSVKPD
jgi:hypothetical protein